MPGARSTRPTIRRVLTTVAAACLAVAVGPATASASYLGVTESPAGNSADPANPGRDLTAAGINYSASTGTLVAAFRLAGTPTADQAFAGIFAGTRGPNGCNVQPAIGVTAYTSTGDAQWNRLDPQTGNQNGRVTVEGRGAAIQTFRVQDDRLKGLRPNCAIASLTQPGDGAVVYDTIDLELVGQPELTAKLTNVPDVFATGRSREVQVRLGNAGDADSGKLRLRLRPAKGVRVTPSVVSVASLKPGAKRTVKVRVTPTSRAATRTDLTAIIGARPIEARATAKIWHRKRQTSKGGGGGAGGGTQICTRWVPDLSGQSGGSLALVLCPR